MGYLGNVPSEKFLTTQKDRFTGLTGSTVTLSHSVSSISDIIVWVNSVKQDYSSLSVSGTTLTLGGNLVSDDVVQVAYIGRTVGTKAPADGTVTNDMLAGSIANSKLANSSITLNGSAVSLGGSATIGGTNTPSFSAYNSSQQSMGTGTNTKVEFNTELFDTDNAFASNTFTVPSGKGGKYWFGASVHFDNASPSRYSLSLRINNVEKNLLEQGNQGSYSGVQTFAVFDLSASDTVDAHFYHNGPFAHNTYAGLQRQWFKGFKLI